MTQGDFGVREIRADAATGTHFRYFDFVMAAFVTVLLLSNIIGAAKRSEIDLPMIGTWAFGRATRWPATFSARARWRT